MFKFIKILGCFTIMVFFIFLVVAIISGGSKIKELGDKTTGVVQKIFNKAADEADKIHKEIKKRIDELGKKLRDERKKDSSN